MSRKRDRLAYVANKKDIPSAYLGKYLLKKTLASLGGRAFSVVTLIDATLKTHLHYFRQIDFYLSFKTKEPIYDGVSVFVSVKNTFGQIILTISDNLGKIPRVSA